MSDTRLRSWVHYDAQDDEKVIAAYADMGVGPAVVFDGGAFTDAHALTAFVADLERAAAWLAAEWCA